MDQPYSVIADWLSKFHTWPESIQALWLIAVPATLLGVTWIVMRGLRDTVAAWRGRTERLLAYGVMGDEERMLVHRDEDIEAGRSLCCSQGRLKILSSDLPKFAHSRSE